MFTVVREILRLRIATLVNRPADELELRGARIANLKHQALEEIAARGDADSDEDDGDKSGNPEPKPESKDVNVETKEGENDSGEESIAEESELEYEEEDDEEEDELDEEAIDENKSVPQPDLTKQAENMES